MKSTMKNNTFKFNENSIKNLILDMFAINLDFYIDKNEIIAQIPIYDKSFEPLEFRISKNGNKLIISDDKYVFGRLYEERIDYKQDRIKSKINLILNQFNSSKKIQLIDEELKIEVDLKNANSEEFKNILLNYINICISILHLSYLN